ncbi:hypothetical protein [Adhaeribacter radiodurans]|uniref:Uncharacterized protein n=1 Tax=Adhaeribacter radiodurans TaxID=2745197 RepID=A0A7L7LCV0_9BACT|nr:hypothetical protein [Adhaeribacter radiodurans]QMU30577.1 hypothetical protein HUW48_22250 [Adhaeribacter radiodurans]
MIYLTKAKILSVLKNINGKEVQSPTKNHFKKKYFYLNKTNIDNITTFYLFFKDPKRFIENELVQWKETDTFIYEFPPAFHKTPECKYLQSRFENIYIPQKVREKKIVKELKIWGNENKTLFQVDRKTYIEKCIKYFNLKYPDLNLDTSDFDEVIKENSGVESFENFTLEELKELIEKYLDDAKKYFEEEQKMKVLEHFKEKSFLKFSRAPIRYNPTDLDDYEVKKILNEIDIKFIKPINEIIIQICVKEFLDKKEFDLTILEALNFRNCKSCFSDFNREIESKSKVHFIDKVKI